MLEFPTSLSPSAKRLHPWALLALGVVAMAATAFSVAVPIAERPSPDGAFAAIAHALVVAVPTAVALAVLRRRPRHRFAWLLFAAGLVWSLSALTESGDSLLYSTGRVADWLAAPVAIYLLLAFPSGRLRDRLDRATTAAACAVVAVLFLPTALVVDQFPLPVVTAPCGTRCPANAFQLTHHQPAVIDHFVRPYREIITTLVMLAAAALLVRRYRSAGPMRRIFVPVVLAGILRASTFGAYVLDRRIGGVGGTAEILGWVYLLSLPAIAAGFGAGLVYARVHAAEALRRLALALPGYARAHAIRAGLASALEDPDLRIFLPKSDERDVWVDEQGFVVEPYTPPEGRSLIEIEATSGLVLIDHSDALALEPALLEVAAAYAMAVLENDRLVHRLRSSLTELRESRARVLNVGDHTREQIGRDLHDGAQQELVILRVKLSAEADRLRERHPKVADQLEGLGLDVEHTIDEVRSLARGIYPATLSGYGLEDSLRWIAVEGLLPATVTAQGLTRYDPEVEAAVYFSCVEALHNAAKHADDARHVWIALVDDGELRFEVRDDGPGFLVDDAWRLGTGLTNIFDRIEAVGGEVTIHAPAGFGTAVSGHIPVSRRRRPQHSSSRPGATPPLSPAPG